MRVSPGIRDLLAGLPRRGGQVAARAAMARLLWSSRGGRRVPAAAAFDRAAARLPRGELAWLCEFNPIGPIYSIPTSPFLIGLARQIRECGARKVLEVAAGDGHLSRGLQKAAPDLWITATDSGAWETAAARMSAREKRELRGTEVAGLPPGAGVLRLEAVRAIRELRPQVVLCSWLPPGPLLAKVIRAAPQVLEIGAGSGITGDIRAWRYEHEFCEGLEALGRCRLDDRPREELHTRVTLYRPFR
jgi:hypothetical protein